MEGKAPVHLFISSPVDKHSRQQVVIIIITRSKCPYRLAAAAAAADASLCRSRLLDTFRLAVASCLAYQAVVFRWTHTLPP